MSNRISEADVVNMLDPNMRRQYERMNARPDQERVSPPAKFRSEAKSKPRGMNKTERRYADELRAKELAGEVDWWKWEAVTLRLAYRTTYTPDFFVVYRDGRIEVIEIKGRLEDDASVKFKIAREAFPIFTFRMLRWVGLGWREILTAKELAA